MRILEKTLAVVVCVVMILLLAGMAVRDPAGPDGEPELASLTWEAADGGTLSEEEVSLSDAAVTVATERAVVFHGAVGETAAVRIVIRSGVNANITLDNVRLQPAGPAGGLSALELGGEQTVRLTLCGENALLAGGPAPAVAAGGNAALTLAGTAGASLEAAGGEGFPAFAAPPAFEQAHVTLGGPAGEVVEHTGASLADWSGLGWVKTQLAEIAGLTVTASTEEVELNGVDAATVQFAAVLEIDTAGGPLSLPVTDPVAWTLEGAAAASVIGADGVLTVDPAETAPVLTVQGSCAGYTGRAEVSLAQAAALSPGSSGGASPGGPWLAAGNGLSVVGPTDSFDYDVSSGELKIKKGGTYHVKNLTASVSTDHHIVVDSSTGDVDLYLDGLNIQATSTPAINLEGGGNVTIYLGDNAANTLVGGIDCAAINVGNAKLTIDLPAGQPNGSLAATGGEHGAGIGGNNALAGSNITIRNGTVTANGGTNAAGIGSGADATVPASNIAILGGTVTAKAGADDVHAISAAPGFGIFLHVTFGSSAAATESRDVVEWTSMPNTVWSWPWVRIAPLTDVTIPVTPASVELTLNGTSPASQTFSAPVLRATAYGGAVELSLAGLVTWTVSPGERASITPEGTLTVNANALSGTLTVSAIYAPFPRVEQFTGTALVTVRSPVTPSPAPTAPPTGDENSGAGAYLALLLGCAAALGAAALTAARRRRG